MANDTNTISAAERNVLQDLMPQKFGILGKLWVVVLALIMAAGFYYYIRHLQEGLSITGMRDYTTWGIYISNFVFFVAISLVGSLVSAILKLSDVKWRTPLTRVSEVIAIAAIIMAAVSIIIDMGRPDRFLNVIIYARLQSPITWDVIVITTYLVMSLLLLYIPMLPDLAIMRDHGSGLPEWRKKMYRILALNWHDTPDQKMILKRCVTTLAVLIIPVAFGIHTVTSWLFATTSRPGWDSTNFGPYFVSGAFMVGAAAVIVAMYALYHFQGLKSYINERHFDNMGKLLVLLSAVYVYFNINEYFVPFYKMKGQEAEHLNSLMYGEYSVMFWSVQILGMALPMILLIFKWGRRPLTLSIISIVVIVGAWFKRYLIVVPTLSHPYIPTHRVPESWIHYSPTFPEWVITASTLAAALMIITLLVRYFPIIPVQETIEELESEASTEKSLEYGE